MLFPYLAAFILAPVTSATFVFWWTCRRLGIEQEMRKEQIRDLKWQLERQHTQLEKIEHTLNQSVMAFQGSIESIKLKAKEYETKVDMILRYGDPHPDENIEDRIV